MNENHNLPEARRLAEEIIRRAKLNIRRAKHDILRAKLNIDLCRGILAALTENKADLVTPQEVETMFERAPTVPDDGDELEPEVDF